MAGLFPNGNLQPSLCFRCSLHLIEKRNVKPTKLIFNSMTLTNDIYFPSNTGKKYSYSDTYKNKASVSFDLRLNEADFPRLSPLIHGHKCRHSTFSNNCNRDLCD